MTGIKPDRRQVIRAGAWTVPAIAVATAAPAHAASAVNLGGSTVDSATMRPGQVLRVVVTIRNAPSAATTTALQVSISVPDIDSLANQPAPPTGWGPPPVTATPPSISGNVITFTSTTQLAPGDSVTVTFDIKRTKSTAGGGAVTFRPGGAVPVTVVNYSFT